MLGSHPKSWIPSFMLASATLVLYLAQYELHEEHFYEMKNWTDKYGYPLESHDVTSEDGFIVTIHRIPCGRKQSSSNFSRPAVLYQSGITTASDSTVMLGPDDDLVLILADNGFDVWINNQRGNHYAKRHVNGTLSDSEHRDYNGPHELGTKDLPAAIDYVLKVTGHQQLNFVGYSMGTACFAGLFTTSPEFSAKIQKAILMAPVLHIIHPLRTYLLCALHLNQYLQVIADFFNLNSRSYVRSLLTHIFINEWNPLTHVIWAFISDSIGEDLHVNFTLMSLQFAQNPSGSFAAQTQHTLDNYHSGRFLMPDYGWRTNQQVYGQSTPLLYNTSLLTVPTHIFYSETDGFITSLESLSYAESIPNVVSINKIAEKKFSHLNYYTNKNNSFFKDVITILKETP